LVVLAIIAIAAGFVGVSILSVLKQQNSRICLTQHGDNRSGQKMNMRVIIQVEAQYRALAIFAPYFRFGIPRCPDNNRSDYANLLDLKKPGELVRCTWRTPGN